MKILSWNVNGARAREAQILELIAAESPDVVSLQETKSTSEELPTTLYGLLALPEYHARWHGLGGYSGVALLLKRSAFESPKFSHPSFDMENRVVEAVVGDRTFVSMYAPNGNKDYGAKMTFFEGLLAYVEAIAKEGRELVIIGDINIARANIDVHKTHRKANVIGQRDEERAIFEALLDKGRLVDVGRKLAPDDDALFSWWPYWQRAREKNQGWRIDYALVSESLAVRAKSHVIRREFGASDHGPLVVELAGC